MRGESRLSENRPLNEERPGEANLSKSEILTSPHAKAHVADQVVRSWIVSQRLSWMGYVFLALTALNFVAGYCLYPHIFAFVCACAAGFSLSEGLGSWRRSDEVTGFISALVREFELSEEDLARAWRTWKAEEKS